MPELPEVETVRRGVLPFALDRTITRVTIRDSRLRWPVPASLPAYLEGRTITGVTRRGKYLILNFDGDRLLIHLGMSGRLRVLDATEPLRPHDHVDLALDNGLLLRLNDPRRFGAILPWPATDIGHFLIDDMGPEPLEADFDAGYLHRRSRKRRVTIKSLLMDSHVVVGVGNIYASEALFRAGIRPSMPAGRLTRAASERLVAGIREVLESAIASAGTSFRDFRGSDGSAGYFQLKLAVYGRAGEECRVCATPIATRRIAQRSSFWCPSCQT